MAKFFTLVFAVLVISFTAMSALAQHTMPPPPYDDFKATRFPDDTYNDRFGFSSRPLMVRSEARVIKDGPLAPAKEDRIALKPFLRADNTGLIRLLPRVFYYRATDPVPRPPVRIPGGGAYYSFFLLTHLYGYGSDIELADSKLSVGFAGGQYGFLANLGDTPLEEITVDDPQVNPLAIYTPPRLESEIREEYRRLGSPEGVTLGGQLFRRSVPVAENSSYILRSIDPRRSDVLVAFRVIRKDADGSIVIAWKLLQRYPTPKMDQFRR